MLTIKQKIEKLSKDLSEFLSGPTLDFVMCQIRVSTVKKRDQRWSHKDKALALSLLHSNPRTYRMLQDVFKLPSVKTLSRVMQKINVYPGFNENIMKALKQKVALQSDQEKL